MTQTKVTDGLVSKIDQIWQNAQVLADAVADYSIEHSVAADLIGAGQVFFPFRYKDQIVFIPAKFLGYAENSVETCIKLRGVRNGGVARSAISKILGYDAAQNDELNRAYLNYCDTIGVKSHNRPHSFWLTGDVKNFLKRDRSGIHDLDQSEIGNDDPEYRKRMAGSYQRVAKVRREVLARANGFCEYGGCKTFDNNQGTPFLETHHIIKLSEKGPDKPSNVIALCPNHHREAHFGKNWQSLQDEFLRIVKGLAV